MSAKTRISGFYRDDAARIAAEAAKKAPIEPAMAPTSAHRPDVLKVERQPSPIVVDEPARPMLAPEPAINQNEAISGERARLPSRSSVRLSRVVARVLIAPFYLAIAVGSAFILVLAAKFLLKL